MQPNKYYNPLIDDNIISTTLVKKPLKRSMNTIYCVIYFVAVRTKKGSYPKQ